MRASLLSCLVTAACGRVGFGERTVADGASADGTIASGHDEDGDGIPDAFDNCPVDGSSADQADSDGDGIGDLCDPHPGDNRDRVAVFATLQPGDQPLELFAGTWTQDPDGLVTAGDGYAEVRIALPLDSARARIGTDVVSLGAPTLQQQLAIGPQPQDDGDRYFGEVNQLPATPAYSGVSWFDGGSTYSKIVASDLHDGAIAVGLLDLEVTLDAASNSARVRSWHGVNHDLYDSTGPGSLGSGVRAGAVLTIGTNNLGLRLRYVWATTTAP